MKEFDVPVLPLETPLRSALATLHFADRGGLATIIDNSISLVSAGAIVHGLSIGRTALSGLEQIDPVAVELPLVRDRVWTITAAGFVAPRGYVSPAQEPELNLFFSRPGTPNFALRALVPGRALIIGETEGVSDPYLAAPTDCYCVQNPRHLVYPPRCFQCSGPVRCE